MTFVSTNSIIRLFASPGNLAADTSTRSIFHALYHAFCPRIRIVFVKNHL